jgi:hypothetical protein
MLLHCGGGDSGPLLRPLPKSSNPAVPSCQQSNQICFVIFPQNTGYLFRYITFTSCTMSQLMLPISLPGLHLAFGPPSGLHLSITWPLDLHQVSTWPPPGLHMASGTPPGLHLASTWPPDLHLAFGRKSTRPRYRFVGKVAVRPRENKQ